MLLTSAFCYPETLEGTLIHLLSLQGVAGLTARFPLHARNEQEQKKEWNMPQESTGGGESILASGSSLPDNLLVTDRSNVRGQLLDALPAILMLGGALLSVQFCGSSCFSYSGMK